MKKYIAKTLSSEDAFINGMTANPADWTGQPVTLVILTTDRAALLVKSKDIDTKSAALKEANTAGAVKNTESKRFIFQAENLAYGNYADNPSELAEYGLKPRKDPTIVPPPTKTIAITLTDDTDGEGIVLTLAAKDDVADFYEYEKGQGTDPKDQTKIPPMEFLKNSSKSSFEDDDVLPGIRYFYRVRAVNRNGQGPWSEAASRVQ